MLKLTKDRRFPYSVNKNWLNIGDQIMLNLKSREADYDVHIDITSDEFGALGTGSGLYYVAQVDIPARQYTETEVENPDYNEEEPYSSKTTIKREAVPFSIDNVTLTLFALKEGVIYE